MTKAQKLSSKFLLLNTTLLLIMLSVYSLLSYAGENQQRLLEEEQNGYGENTSPDDLDKTVEKNIANKPVATGKSVKMIVGGQSEDGVARETFLPVED